MVFGGQINITASVTGIESLMALQRQIMNINAVLEDQEMIQLLAGRQTEKEIAQLQLSNAFINEKLNLSDAYVDNLADEIVENGILMDLEKQRLQEAVDARMMMNFYGERGIEINREYARYSGIMWRQSIEDAKEATAANTAVAESQRVYRRELMQSSISMFVLNISASQMISSLKPLVKGNEMATKAIDTMIASLRLALTPMQTYLAVLQIMAASQGHVALTAIYMSTAMAAAFLWITALQQKSSGIRAVLMAIAGAMTVVAIATWGAASGMATFQTLLGNFAAMAALVAGAAILSGVVGVITTPPKAMTLSGQQKHVRRGGIAELDAGETVTRKNGGGFGDMGGEWHFHFDKATSKSDASEFGKAFAKEVTRGGGKSKSRRVAVYG